MPTKAQWTQIKWVVGVYFGSLLFALIGAYLTYGHIPIEGFLYGAGLMGIIFLAVGLARYNYPDEDKLPASKEAINSYSKWTLSVGIILIVLSIFLLIFSHKKSMAIINLIVGAYLIWYGLRKKSVK